jgi:hypothetical protein
MTDIALQNDASASAATAVVLAGLGRGSIVLVGMMGVGKSSVGRRLAARLSIPFVDADTEIEKAAGMSIADIFARHGEADFRNGEARVMLYHRGSAAYWCDIILRHGLLRGELLRGHSPEEIMGRYVEFNESGGCPLVKVYSRGQARELFSMFGEVKIQVEQLTRPELYILGRFIPEGVFRQLRRSVGSNVIVSARK